VKTTADKKCRFCGKLVPKDAPFYTTRAYCSARCALDAADRRARINREKREKELKREKEKGEKGKGEKGKGKK
jgi:endogenous inhibitor of DNA gyrase (YacG/DUF329 family)